MDLPWLDILLMMTIAALSAFAAQRRLTGFLVGMGGVILFRPLYGLMQTSLLLPLVLALVVGLGLGYAGPWLEFRLRLRETVGTVLGGVGGFLLGVVLTLGLATALPIERDINNFIIYPPRNLPAPFGEAVQNSQLVDLGRDILLYPLLENAGQIDPASRGFISALHGFFVVRAPWEGG